MRISLHETTIAHNPAVTISCAPCLGSAHAEDVPKLGGELTCRGPVTDKDTGESLYQRYGEQAVVREFPVGEYDYIIGVELFPYTDAPFDVKLVDSDFLENVASIEVRNTAWSVEGLKIGMSLDEVAAANGRPFELRLTDDEFAGDGTFQGGRLDKLDGGCRLKVLFTIPDELQRSFNGKQISSDSPELVKPHPAVSALALSWPRR